MLQRIPAVALLSTDGRLLAADAEARELLPSPPAAPWRDARDARLTTTLRVLRPMSDGSDQSLALLLWHSELPVASSPLSPSLQELAELLGDTGLSYKEIASLLGKSVGTVRKQVETLYRRASVHSRAELAVRLRGA